MTSEKTNVHFRTANEKTLVAENATRDPQSRAHPDFASEDADVMLCSQDNITFKVHSIILKMSSGWFRATFSLPQTMASSTLDEPIFMSETSDVIVALLSVPYGLSQPPFDTMDFVEAVVHAAEKYDMLGVLSIVRLALNTPSLVETHPLRVYGIATRWGWHEEAKLASSHTLTIDLYHPDVLPKLKAVEPLELGRLFGLHRRRRDALRNGLDASDVFYANVLPGKCPHCQAEAVHDRWMRLKYAWTAAFESAPMDVATRNLLERPEVVSALEHKCARCSKTLYNVAGTIENLRKVLDRLPRTVEFE